MKILFLADQAEPSLWEHLNRNKLEGVELIISCGDLPASYLSFLTCFTQAPILYIHGNHDDSYAQTPPEGCICIDGQLYVYNGLRIVGLGGCRRYTNGVNQYTERQMQARVRRLRFKLWRHGGMDLLVTHAPAFDLGDDEDLSHTGFDTFLRLMDKYHPAAFVHGHVHQSYHYNFKRERSYGCTKVINACGSFVLDLPMPNSKA